MIIGIDIDGVLNYMHEFIIEYGSKICNESGKYKIENINAQWSTEIFSWPNEMAHELWDKYGEELYVKSTARSFASEVIKKLKEQNNEIYIITARRNNDDWFPPTLRENAEMVTVNWLNENKIIYDKIYFDSKDKSKVCRELGVDIMIEDDPKNIDMLLDTTKLLIYDTVYNRLDKYKEMERAYSWYDVYMKINKH
ncbi:MAG: hypothetical protein J6C46_01580 [Clostridia bacterium]|nr:hypothetical protein [Clostridia bacterium]